MASWSKSEPAHAATHASLVERGQIGVNVEFRAAGTFFLANLVYFSPRKSTRELRAMWLAKKMVSDITNGGGTPKGGVDAKSAIYETLSKDASKLVSDLGQVVKVSFDF